MKTVYANLQNIQFVLRQNLLAQILIQFSIAGYTFDMYVAVYDSNVGTGPYWLTFVYSHAFHSLVYHAIHALFRSSHAVTKTASNRYTRANIAYPTIFGGGGAIRLPVNKTSKNTGKIIIPYLPPNVKPFVDLRYIHNPVKKISVSIK